MPEDRSYQTLPTQDFTLLEPIPGETELTIENSNVVRRMPETGDLLSNNNYLDLLFRLLFEDAVSDLRKGVRMMQRLGRFGQRLTKKEIKAKAREENVKLHEEV